MIAHLFGKVYLNFDATFKPAFDTLIVSNSPIVPHDSFINQHIGMGTNHGKYNHASFVPWKDFFESVNDRRTIIYADTVSFPVVYFNFLKKMICLYNLYYRFKFVIVIYLKYFYIDLEYSKSVMNRSYY